MSLYAQTKSDDGTLINKFARDCTEADRDQDFYCPICGNPVYLRLGPMRRNHFFGDHLNGEECKLPKNVKVTPEGYVFNLAAMLDYKDRPITPGPTKGPGGENGGFGGGEPGGDGSNEEDVTYISGMIHLNRIVPLYTRLCNLGENDVIDVDNDLTVSDFVINEKTIFSCRKEGINKQIRLVTARRFRPNNLPDAPRKPGYVLLRDAFTRDDKDAIYFLVRLAEPSQDKKFHDLLFGSEADGVVKCPKKHIILLATWTRVANKNYQVYEAVINSRCYAFVD